MEFNSGFKGLMVHSHGHGNPNHILKCGADFNLKYLVKIMC